jgi:hypothetical protein
MGGSTTNPGIVVCQQNFGWFYFGMELASTPHTLQ